MKYIITDEEINGVAGRLGQLKLTANEHAAIQQALMSFKQNPITDEKDAKTDQPKKPKP